MARIIFDLGGNYGLEIELPYQDVVAVYDSIRGEYGTLVKNISTENDED